MSILNKQKLKESLEYYKSLLEQYEKIEEIDNEIENLEDEIIDLNFTKQAIQMDLKTCLGKFEVEEEIEKIKQDMYILESLNKEEC